MNRGVAQLTRLDVSYSLAAGASRGVREFVEGPLLKQFQKAHPHVQLTPKINTKGFPTAEATYLNNRQQNVTLRYATDASSVLAALSKLAAQSGRPLRGLSKWPFAQTRMASVQGSWDSSFGLKSDAEQLAPLLHTQTHLIGLAPTEEAMAAVSVKKAATGTKASSAKPAK